MVHARVPLVLVFVFTPGFSPWLFAAPQAAEEYKLRMLQRAADELAVLEYDHRRHRFLRPNLAMSAAAMGEPEMLRQQLEQINDKRKHAEYGWHSVEILAQYGHLELIPRLATDLPNCRGKLFALTKLALVAGKMGNAGNDLFDRVVEMADGVPEFDFEKERVGTRPAPEKQRFDAQTKRDLMDEIRFVHVCGLAESGVLDKAEEVTNSIRDARLRDSAAARIAEASVKKAEFRRPNELQWMPARRAAVLAEVQWLLANRKIDQAVELVINSEHGAIEFDTLVDLATTRSQNLNVEKRMLVADRIVALNRQVHELYEESNPQEWQYEFALTDAAEYELLGLADYPWKYYGKSDVIDALVALEQISPDKSAIPARIRKAGLAEDWIRIRVDGTLASGDWTQAESLWRSFFERHEEDPFDSNRPLNMDPFFERAAEFAAKSGDYQAAAGFIEKIDDLKQKERPTLRLAARQIQSGDHQLARETTGPVEQSWFDGLPDLDEEARLKWLIDSAMTLGWKIGMDIDYLPMADRFEEEILAIGKPEEALLQIGKYLGSFTPVGPSSKRFGLDLQRKLNKDGDAAITSPAEEIKRRLKELNEANYKPDSRIVSKFVSDLLPLVRQMQEISPNDDICKHLMWLLCADENEEMIEEMLDLIKDPANRISAMGMVAEMFAPVTTPIYTEPGEDAVWGRQRVRVGGVF